MGDCSDFLYNLAFLLDETFRPSVNHGWFNVAFFGLRLEVEQVNLLKKIQYILWHSRALPVCVFNYDVESAFLLTRETLFCLL